jgi:translation elongation factor EF-1alpha
MPAKKKKAAKKKAVRKPAKRKVIKRKTPVKKAAVKKPKKALAKKKAPAPKPAENLIGEVTHYFPHVQAAVIKLSATLVAGENIKIKGHTTDFAQTVSSMQINHVPVSEAKKGDEIGLLVQSRVRAGDTVCRA